MCACLLRQDIFMLPMFEAFEIITGIDLLAGETLVHVFAGQFIEVI